MSAQLAREERRRIQTTGQRFPAVTWGQKSGSGGGGGSDQLLGTAAADKKQWCCSFLDRSCGKKKKIFRSFRNV